MDNALGTPPGNHDESPPPPPVGEKAAAFVADLLAGVYPEPEPETAPGWSWPALPGRKTISRLLQRGRTK